MKRQTGKRNKYLADNCKLVWRNLQLFNYVPIGRFFASDITENDTIEGNEKKLNCVSEEIKRRIRGKKQSLHS